MNTKPLGVIAALLASFAVILLGVTVALSLPVWVRIAMIVFALIVLAASGGFIGVAVSAQRRAQSAGAVTTEENGAAETPDETNGRAASD